MSSVKDYLDAKDAAKWADEFSAKTKTKGRSTAQKKKYGKWAKSEAKIAHAKRSSALKKNRDYKPPTHGTRKK